MSGSRASAGRPEEQAASFSLAPPAAPATAASAGPREKTSDPARAGVRRPRRQGPVAAALLGLGAGQFAMAVFSLLSQWLNPTEWIPKPGQEGGVRMILMWSNRAVMTGLFFETVLVWAITWLIAYEALGRRRSVGKAPYVAAVTLMVLGIVFSFTPVYNWLIPG